MDNLTPITREEMLMNDETLTPITREEKILAGEDLNPVTRREYFLKKYRHAGGEVMVEGLSVTENGTYTAPEGKAYSPVEVAVPLPENAYLLKEASGSLVSFNDGADLPMPSFICKIDTVQDLHGYDAPWVGGAGKNKLEIMATSNSEMAGVTYTIKKDSDNNKIGIVVDGNSTALSYAIIATGDRVLSLNHYTATLIPAGTEIKTCPTPAKVTLNFRYTDGTYENFVQNKTITLSKDVGSIYIQVDANTTVSNQTVEPYIYLATETSNTFTPYSNICPIIGHTGLNAWVRGKSLLPLTLDNVKALNTYGTWDGNVYNTQLGVTFTFTTNNDGSITSIKADGTSPSKNVTLYLQQNITNSTYPNEMILSGCTSGGGSSTYKIRCQMQLSPNTTIADDFGEGANFTIPNDGNIYQVIIRIQSGVTVSNLMFYPMMRLAIIEDATFEPYNPNSQTISVSWQTEAGEVYGGEIDLVSGELTVTDGYIASYNGETLPSTWISDRDIYAEGTTPTMGAEVVYKLANAQTYQLDGNQIKSLLGTNNAWCDTGDVDIDYFAKEVEG